MTHGLLASPLVCLGAKPPAGSVAPYFMDKLILDETSATLLAERLVGDFESSPQQLRKAANAQERCCKAPHAKLLLLISTRFVRDVSCFLCKNE